jgi:hypothetical protein
VVREEASQEARAGAEVQDKVRGEVVAVAAEAQDKEEVVGVDAAQVENVYVPTAAPRRRTDRVAHAHKKSAQSAART